jgi:probable F420-dependent oxidoreductase
VKVGVIFSQADSGTDPGAMRDWARTAEAAGFDHLMAYDHVLGASGELYPDGVGAFPTAPYTQEHTFHEVLVLFGHLAAVTERIELVTSVLVLPQRPAALVAKQVATIDLLSAGRLRLAVGVGWSWAEYEGLGVDFATREERLEEQIEVMRLLWTEPLVTFHGRFHHLDRVGINPLPTRPISVWIGSGASPRALSRVVRCADGWMPLLLPGLDRVDLAEAVARLRAMAEEAGRDPASLPIHGRVYLDDGFEARAEQAAELGFSDLSIGFNRRLHPGRSHAEHLERVLEVKPVVDRLVGRA